jgi:hypothetical protein
MVRQIDRVAGSTKLVCGLLAPPEFDPFGGRLRTRSRCVAGEIDGGKPLLYAELGFSALGVFSNRQKSVYN